MTSLYHPVTTNGNGSEPAPLDLHAVVSELTAVKSQLAQKIGSSDDPDLNFQVGLLDQIAARLQGSVDGQLILSNQQLLRRDRDRLFEILGQLRQTETLDGLLTTTAGLVQSHFQATRALIVQLKTSTQGTVVAEVMERGWTPTLGEILPALSFGLDPEVSDFPLIRWEDISHAGLTPYQQQLMERFQVRANLAVGIRLGDSLWGLLVVQQCNQTRLWQESDVNFLYQVATELSLLLQQSQFEAAASHQIDQERTVNQLTMGLLDRIRQAANPDQLLQTTTHDLRQRLKTDRVAVYQFNPDWSGQFVSESVGEGWIRLLGKDFNDIYSTEAQESGYRQGKTLVVNDLQRAGLSTHQIELVEKFQAQAYAIVPILQGDQLWGLLTAYQNSGPRYWQDSEVQMLVQAGARIGSGLKPMNDLESMLKPITFEVRRLLKTDRVALYRFNPDWSGQFIAESVTEGWVPLMGKDFNDTYFTETQGSAYQQGKALVVPDLYQSGHTACHIELLERFQAKAYVVVPVIHGTQLWGLLGVYQNSGARQWQDDEVEMLRHLGSQLGETLQLVMAMQKSQQQIDQDQRVTQLLTSMLYTVRKTFDSTAMMKSLTQELRQQLKADRVAIFRFDPDWTGEFVAESVSGNWVKLMGKAVRDTFFAEEGGIRYRQKSNFIVDDLYKQGSPACFVELMESFQARAWAIVPIMQGETMWGLLGAYQNSDPRHWQDHEISLLSRISTQLGSTLQLSESLSDAQSQAKREQTLTKIVDNIRKSLDPDPIFKSTTQEVLQVLNCERVALYKFNPDWSGEFVAEYVVPGWVKLLGSQVKDTYFERNDGGRYVKGEFQVISDVYTAGFDPCHLQLLEQFQARAYIIVPVLLGDKLWGLLAAYQNSTTRQWQDSEVNLLFQIGSQFGVALQQAEYVNQLARTAEREKATARLISAIRQTQDPTTIFKVATQEVRAQLKSERVGVYRFNPDWSGEFIAESAAPGWISLIQEKGEDPMLTMNTTENERCTIKDLAQRSSFSEDTYLQRTKGGRYRKGEAFKKVDDIYEAGFTDCYIRLLERYQARAYVIVPIVQGEKLWGLFAAYQNSAPREWEESDILLMQQIGEQLGIALDQAEYLEQLRQQSEQLATAAAREKAAKEQLQQRAIQLLVSVRPVFSGDLTVRAPITEDEVGTIADAYNNTIQSLRRLVTQVQTAAGQVAETIVTSETSIIGLSAQARQQLVELTQAQDQMQTAAISTQAVEVSAAQVESAVQQANQTLQAGDQAMNRTVDGIQAIRDTVSETSKKIKRLSESSQKISKVVNLISNFATQTNLLALNAAIEATRAGEYGRGFAVVADEVRSLARQSASATAEIETLVQDIQAETSDVTIAMETGIRQVVEGTSLVNETRQSLNAIVESTNQISQLVERITEATAVQGQQSQVVTKTMSEVASIASKTSEESDSIVESFGQLLSMAQELQASVSQFKVN